MSWYLKKAESGVYGPVDLATLQSWAMDGRVAPGDEISEDKASWTPASDLPDLSMEYIVELRDRTAYGPIHLLALRELLQDGSVSRRARVTHKKTGDVSVVSVALLPVLIAQNSKLESLNESLRDHLIEAQRKLDERGELNEQVVTHQSGNNDEELKALGARIDELAEQNKQLQADAEKWKKLADERREEVRQQQKKAASAADERNSEELKVLNARIDELAEQNKQLQADAEKWKKLADERGEEVRQQQKKAASAADGRNSEELKVLNTRINELSERNRQLQADAEKWKKLADEREKQTAKVKTPVSVMTAAAGKDGQRDNDLVPRALLEEAERKLAQRERSYQQLVRGMSRGQSNGKGRNQPIPSADQLRRRDVS